jgi:hypothetical protein
MSGCEMPQPPLDPIARNGIPNSTTDHKADPRPIGQMRSMDHQSGSARAHPTPGRLPEILCAAHSQRSVQHAFRSTRLSRTGGCGLYDAGPK